MKIPYSFSPRKYNIYRLSGFYTASYAPKGRTAAPILHYPKPLILSLC